MNKYRKITIIIGIILGIVVVGLVIFYSLKPPQTEAGRFVINLNTSEEEIINQLQSEGYLRGWLRSPTVFKLSLSLFGWHDKIEPGAYRISKDMFPWTIGNILVEFPYQKWVILPEGLREEQMAEILQEELEWTDHEKEQFLLYSKEGYSFPDTYLLNLDYTGYEVGKRLKDRFNEKVADLFKQADEQNILNDSLIVLASLVQREAANEEQMPLIAGIIWNRWLKGMKFEIDATLQYALGESGNWWKVVKPEDKQIDSPYNTYLYEGRPPEPICNPGLAAIKSIIYPEESDYLYYLHDSEGQIHPAITYEEHQMNIEVYLKDNPCTVCSEGCDTCPEGCEPCLNSKKREIDPSPNWKWYYNPDNFNGGNRQIEIETDPTK